MWNLSEKLFEDTVESFAFANNVFSDKEISKIIKLGKSKKPGKALVAGGKGTSDNKVRKGKTAWITPCEDSEWLFRKLTDIIVKANKDFFNFELHGMLEPLQFTIYDGKKTKYNAHVDRVKNSTSRKLSVVVQLSDPKDYEGGCLELFSNSLEPNKIEKKKGLITFFPSYMLHRVTPVTKGERLSLVIWVHGPSFR